MKLLVLGGTAEARQVAEATGAVLSLAGATRKPLAMPHRVGGFGGVAGLVGYLQAEGFTAIIDATHPFAAQMSRHAYEASAQCGLPLLRLARPPWPEQPAWQMVESLSAAAAALPSHARAFLTVGSQSLAPFLPRDDVWFLSRSIEPAAQSPVNGTAILQRPPFSLQTELALMAAHNITHLVSKNAGGEATAAKLTAADALGLQVIMVKRPRLPAVLTVETVAQAVKWVENIGE